MVKKCIYCGKIIAEESVIDFCETCGKGAFGEKTFNAIVQNMENARSNGDLCLDHGDSSNLNSTKANF
jgi:predicted  nucleic acid-binding Zn-ribbon protein